MSGEPNESLTPGEFIRPQVSIKTATSLVERLYGVKVKRIKELVSYDDKNYKVEVEESYSNPHIKQLYLHGYTLKILNRMESPKQHVEAEHQMLRILQQKGINCIQPVLNINGDDFSRETLLIETEGEDKWSENNDITERPSAVNLVRLLTFVPGSTLHSVPYTPAILYDAGYLLGRIDKAFEGFSHPALTNMKTVWSLKNLSELRTFLFVVKDEHHRKIVSEVIEAFEKEVVPNFPTFRKAVIHGDFNEQNILVEERPPDEQTEVDKYTAASVIDFGDAQEAYYNMDAAIAIMYMMVDNQFMDPLDVGGHFLVGYQKSIMLLDDEFDALRVLVAGRFCQSLVLGAYSYMQDPGNEYLLVTATRGWQVLGNLWQTSKDELYSRWKEIMKTYK